jgi:hypothetical protein
MNMIGKTEISKMDIQRICTILVVGAVIFIGVVLEVLLGRNTDRPSKP